MPEVSALPLENHVDAPKEAVDLLKKIFAYNPNRRPTAL